VRSKLRILATPASRILGAYPADIGVQPRFDDREH